MAQSPDAPRYYLEKEYPSIIGRIGRMAFITAGGLIFLHVAPDLIQNTSLHTFPLIEGVAQQSDRAFSALSSGTAWIGDHMPFIGQYMRRASQLALNNPISDTVLPHIPNASRYVQENDLVTAQVAGVAGGISGVVESGIVAVKKPTTAPAPTDAQREHARRVVARLQQRYPVRHRRTNEAKVAVEIAGVAEDLRKGEIDSTAVFARFLGPTFVGIISRIPYLRNRLTPEWAAKTTLRKEVYRRLRGGPDHRLWGMLDSLPAEWFKKIPGPGDGLNYISDLGDYGLGIFRPKKDIFGKYHFGIDDIVLDTFATLLGDNIPFVTSGDFQESVEVMARPELATGFHGEVDKAAALIAGSKVHHIARRFGKEPQQAN